MIEKPFSSTCISVYLQKIENVSVRTNQFGSFTIRRAVRLFVCSFVRLLVCLFVHLCVHLFVTSTIYCGRRLNESLSCFFARRETEKRFQEKNKEIVTKFFCFVYPVYLPLFLCIFHCRKVSVEDAFILFLRFIPKICF